MAIKGHNHKTGELNNATKILTSLTAGAIAGALAKTTIAPLDRTKINFQIGKNPYSTRKALKFLKQTYKQEGFIALWRGNSATMARIVPYAAIQFTAHEEWKKVLGVDGSRGKESPKKLFLAGSLAGVTSQSLTYPLDLARARMAVTKKIEYATLREVFVKVYKEEGLRAFYKGYISTIAGVIPYAGVSFFTYDTLKQIYKDKFEEKYSGFYPLVSLFMGACAGMLGQTSSYPLDIIRRRMQTDTQGRYPTIKATILYMHRTEGLWRALYKGLSMNWIKGPIAVGISYATYDNTKESLRAFLIDKQNKKISVEKPV
ncbi:mitochondrial coenzyme A transporter SLC25A42 [Coccinella septempunctata]|uniref:mitochondrial coenzyme A transporter SLC25A42 n=1 Tax=Coccinella septempunctata TaxID=41139 RepID=UPI001D066B5C|nr:mitochondrial coenzyme A transporter SLC25A42 [Coccinella septempunctata]XP_044751973.1 mitochondrial coenzyme A transporter SLC25A42 [Coccinella septempunctata]XP_044751975.1 mitochondrial coenzyme A transporter SLC25A42 [Coccinella septempunctata]XP_044751976.1 mitochondrial coenzyme A transporter SLC25A42 [Coccinella septempunctata]